MGFTGVHPAANQIKNRVHGMENKMSDTKSVIKTNIKYLMFMLVFAAAVMMMAKTASADAVDYLSNNYNGTTNSETKMYTKPGTVNPATVGADGEPLVIPEGTTVFITGEQYDPDFDVWYECQVTLDGTTYDGYVYTGRVTRGEAVAFTPTPAPTEAPTPEATESPSADITDAADDKDGVDKDTKQMIEDSNSFEPWKWILILLVVIVVFMIVYTVWVKQSEEKLEREIERYSNRPQYEPLDGELDEDFEEAKSNYYDHIGLGDQEGRDLGEIIGNPDDVQLDMTGIFEDEESAEESAEDKQESVEDILAALESRQAAQREEYESPAYEEQPMYAEAPVYEEQPVYAEQLSYEEPQHVEIPQPVKRPSKGAVIADLDRLNALTENERLLHRAYGKGIVVDNTDPEIIQVKFGDEMRFLKKDKLAAKGLVKVSNK